MTTEYDAMGNPINGQGHIDYWELTPEQVAANEANGGVWGDIKRGGMWLVDNGLYNTQRPWYTGENLFNIGFLGVSAVAGAFSGGTGTGLLIGGRMGLTAAGRVVIKEAVEDFAVKPALKGALKAGVAEPLATAPVMGAIGALGTDEEPLTQEELDAELQGISNMYQEQLIQQDDVAEQSPEMAAEQNVDSVRKAFMDTFNSVAGMIGMFVPKQSVAMLAGVAAAFVIATSGDGDDSTNKMQELSGLPELFMEAALGIETKETAPVYTTEQRPAAGAPTAAIG